MIFTSANLRYRLAVSKGDWITFRNANGDDGFRTHALTLSGPASDPRYTGVMVKRATPFKGESILSASESELRTEIQRLASEKGLHPYIVAATGSPTAPVYAAAFRELSEPPVVELNLSQDAYLTANIAQHDAGRILVWVDSFGSAADIRYCAVWGPNPGRVAWNTDGLNDMGDARQQRFDAMVSVGARRSLVAMTPAGGLATLYVDSRIDDWLARPSLTRSAMDAEAATQAAAGRFPVCIGATVVGTETHFSPIFASGDTIQARTWRVRGPAPIGLSQAELAKAGLIDSAMEGFVKDMNLRGAALAIVEGTRLVYARGYTFAESGYPDVEPTTLFRQASVSKLFCAIAMWKLMADDPAFSRGSTLQSVLNLKTPDGQPPVDGDFAKITMRHLLESNSGITQSSVWDTINARRDGNGAQPMTADQIASAIAALQMPGTPGAAGQADYGRTDYFLLSRVVARKKGFSDFEQALKQVVLDPLKMTRTRGSRSLVENQAADEARYHLTSHRRNDEGKLGSTHLEIGTSVRHADRRLVPVQYGAANYEVFDGAGGLSSAVIDVARLCAMLACRQGNPVLSPAVIDELFADAVKATAERPSHGFHGFDGAEYTDGSKQAVSYHKGGNLNGVRTSAVGVTGGRVYVIAYNGDPAPDANTKWKDLVAPLGDAVDWGTGDLFPHYGMPSLTGGASTNRVTMSPVHVRLLATEVEDPNAFRRRR